MSKTKTLNKAILTPKGILIIALFALIVFGGAVGYKWWQRSRGDFIVGGVKIPEEPLEEEIKAPEDNIVEKETPEAGVTEEETSQDSAIEGEAEEETADWQTYRNEEWRFEVDHPKEWEITGLSETKILFVDSSEKEKDSNFTLEERGIVVAIYSFNEECVDFDWQSTEEVLEINFHKCGLPILTSHAWLFTTKTGVKGRIDDLAGISMGSEVGGPVGFALFPLQANNEEENPVLLFYFMRGISIEDQVFEKFISTLKFID